MDTFQSSVWGNTPSTQSIIYAFNNIESHRQKQDLGYDGLNDDEELLGSYHDNSRWIDRLFSTAGKKTVGKSLLIAPINKAGVVLSHPPIKTTPSIG